MHKNIKFCYWKKYILKANLYKTLFIDIEIINITRAYCNKLGYTNIFVDSFFTGRN